MYLVEITYGVFLKISPKKFHQKNSSRKIPPKNPPEKFPKNFKNKSKEIPKNSQKFSKKIITNIALRGRNPFRACFLSHVCI